MLSLTRSNDWFACTFIFTLQDQNQPFEIVCIIFNRFSYFALLNLNAWQVDPNSWLGSSQSWQRWVAAPRSQQTAHIWGQTKVNLTKPQTCQPSERIRLPYSSHDICSVQEENNKTSYFLMPLKAFILHDCNVCSPSRSCFFFVVSPQGTFLQENKTKKWWLRNFRNIFLVQEKSDNERVTRKINFPHYWRLENVFPVAESGFWGHNSH